MRYLKQRNLSRRMPADTTLYSDTANANVYIAPTGAGSLVIPVGTNAQRPSSPTNGMIRYNSDVVTGGQVEFYAAGRWRALRFAEQGQITQQSLGAGDGTTAYFGPLNSTYYNPSNNGNNVTVGGQNIIVVVENVIQISGTNYTVVQNPTIGAETYTPKLSYNATVGSTTLYFNTSLVVTGASGNGTTATLTFATQTQVPFAVGATIVVTGITPLGYNGTFTVTGSTSSSVSFANTTSSTYQNGGEIDSSGAVYPAVNITGASVTGSNIPGSTTVSSYVTDPVTGALKSIVINNATTTSTIPVNTTITITENSQVGSGYYLYFSSPPPYGKTVTAILGFDQ